MKHVLFCIICTVLLFSYIGQRTVFQEMTVSTGTNVANVARLAATTQSSQAAEPIQAQQMQVGILLGHADDMGTAQFCNTFEKALGTTVKVNNVDTSGNEDTRKAMFDKMIESNYNLIVLEHTQGAADYYIDTAGQAGIPVIIIGAQPAQSLLTKYPGIYYMGFSSDSIVELMAQETYNFWQNNPTMMDFENDEWDLTYSAITSTGFADTGSSTAFENAMSELGVSAQMAVDSIIQPYDYNLHKEIDQTIIDDSEIVFYDSSAEAQKAINYFYDPTEFSKRPRQQLALSTIDDGAAKLVEDGEVLFACGTDTHSLGAVAARLAQLLMAGQEPTFQSLEMEQSAERVYHLPCTVLRAAIEPEPVEEEAEGDS